MAESVERQRLHAVVEGMVQGVGFRAFVAETADSLDLTGWVRNTFSGNVEVTAEGPRPQLEKLLEKLRAGPRMSYVENVTQEWSAATGEYGRFFVARTQ